MINKIIDLLPSPDLKAKIKEINYQFSEIDLLQIIYNYAPSFDLRLSLLEQFSSIACQEASSLAKAYIKFENEKFNLFTESKQGFVYELLIRETPDSYQERYICSSYNSALICIDRFYQEYADVNAEETQETRYEIKKRKIFSENDSFEEDIYGECSLGPNKTLLKVRYDKLPFDDCSLDIPCYECKQICPFRCDEIYFPCLYKHLDVIKYYDYRGVVRFGVNYLGQSECDRTETELYLIPIHSDSIRKRQFDDEFYDHVHVELPNAFLATPDDLDEADRKNYFDFVEYLKTKKSI